MHTSYSDYVVGHQVEIVGYLLEIPDFRLIHTSQLQSNNPLGTLATSSLAHISIGKFIK